MDDGVKEIIEQRQRLDRHKLEGFREAIENLSDEELKTISEWGNNPTKNSKTIKINGTEYSREQLGRINEIKDIATEFDVDLNLEEEEIEDDSDIRESLG
jgi:hypothetical protein